VTGRRLLQKRNATVAVIGAGDYIGAEIAKKFASEGFTVFAGRRNGAKLEPLVKEIEKAGGEIHARWRSASSTSALTSAFRFWILPNGYSARSGKWPAIPAFSLVAKQRG
jgi:hypothetical protein